MPVLPVLDPQGPVALAERDLMVTALAVMLLVLVCVYGLTLYILRTYKAGSGNHFYQPDWSYSVVIDAVTWLVPALIVALLGLLLWQYTHRLDPYRPLASAEPPLEVEVVAQDWKWLFIYPAQNIASVNELVFPSGRPLSLRITSDTAMNSFYIPGLGGQIYAMAGMETHLNLLADAPTALRGRNTQYSGRGFADQHFAARATSAADFDNWVGTARATGARLDAAAYAALAKPSSRVAPVQYGDVLPDLFADIIAKYAGPAAHAGHVMAPAPQADN